MQIQTYDYITSLPLATLTSLDNLDFGDVIQGQHCSKPVVIKAISDNYIADSSIILYLENKGIQKTIEYGYYVSTDFKPSIEAGSSTLSNHFIETPDASSTSPNGLNILWDGTKSDYIWMDCHIGDSTGIINPNFRIFL